MISRRYGIPLDAAATLAGSYHLHKGGSVQSDLVGEFKRMPDSFLENVKAVWQKHPRTALEKIIRLAYSPEFAEVLRGGSFASEAKRLAKKYAIPATVVASALAAFANSRISPAASIYDPEYAENFAWDLEKAARGGSFASEAARLAKKYALPAASIAAALASLYARGRAIQPQEIGSSDPEFAQWARLGAD
jgi:hypothetical protein